MGVSSAAAAGPLVDLDAAGAPIYLQLITIFRRQIALGGWPVDARIPTIEALARQYGVANGTVRQALTFLEREGLIRRMRRRGTFVLKQPDQPEKLNLPRTRQELRALLTKLKISDALVGEAPDGEGMRTVQLRFSRRDIPVMVERARFNPLLLSPCPTNSELLKCSLLASEGLKDRRRCSEIARTIIIGTADAETARQLEVPVNAAVAVVRHRVADRKGRLLVESEWLLRGDLLSITEHFAAH